MADTVTFADPTGENPPIDLEIFSVDTGLADYDQRVGKILEQGAFTGLDKDLGGHSGDQGQLVVDQFGRVRNVHAHQR